MLHLNLTNGPTGEAREYNLLVSRKSAFVQRVGTGFTPGPQEYVGPLPAPVEGQRHTVASEHANLPAEAAASIFALANSMSASGVTGAKPADHNHIGHDLAVKILTVVTDDKLQWKPDRSFAAK